jgi:tripartite-type tricarboxylate transporter receptor subunit TctC
MKILGRQILQLAAAAVGLPAISRVARAQTYPMRPITINVPSPAGGPTDAVGRVVGERMQGSLGQRIVVENVSGAGGTIALGRVARAPADGKAPRGIRRPSPTRRVGDTGLLNRSVGAGIGSKSKAIRRVWV